jgi:hypothetical protein
VGWAKSTNLFIESKRPTTIPVNAPHNYIYIAFRFLQLIWRGIDSEYRETLSAGLQEGHLVLEN